ncbi:MAG: L,D-transpeptidase [Anaerolineales bacterium]|nr:L,D-transpeptidase [Anaerolineales bacterium]
MNRRDFLKLGTLSAGVSLKLAYSPPGLLPDFAESEHLGRVAVAKVDLHSRPDATSNTIGALYEDAVVAWQREIVGYNPYRFNQRWVETPDGYLWSGNIQPVQNNPNQPVQSLPEPGLGQGMWVRVTVPWVDIILANPPARAPSLKENPTPRLYYSQILWADHIQQDDTTGKTFYRLTERYGYGDIFLAEASAFQPLSPDEFAPISPDVDDKRVVVDVTRQTMSCFEGNREVHFCRISTGPKFYAYGNEVDEWATPLGSHPIWRKVVSLHMSGGTTGGGYDLPGIGWTTLFVGNGVAIHSTFWHNNFGVPMSHGCVNARPEDAHWVFRWTAPYVPQDPGDVTVSMPGGTQVQVIEA